MLALALTGCALSCSVEYSLALTETEVEMRPMYCVQPLNTHRELVAADEKKRREENEKAARLQQQAKVGARTSPDNNSHLNVGQIDLFSCVNVGPCCCVACVNNIPCGCRPTGKQKGGRAQLLISAGSKRSRHSRMSKSLLRYISRLTRYK